MAKAQSEAPASVADVQALCRTLSGGGSAISVSSSNHAALVCLAEFTEVALDADGGTLRAAAGASISDVTAAAAKSGFEALGLATAHKSRHVGALVARGEIARRGICGIEVILSNGDVVISGGRVQKDVAGYDLAGAFLGSLGKLGVITYVTLRLVPQGTAPQILPGSRSSATPGPDLRQAFDPAGAFSRS